MNTFYLDILEADGVFYSGYCVSLIVPTMDGQYGIQARHSNLILPVVTGVMEYTASDGTRSLASVAGGIVKVENGRVLILVEAAEHPEEIDENRAKRAEAAAKEELLQKRSIREYNEAQSKLARAINRLRLRNRYDRMRRS